MFERKRVVTNTLLKIGIVLLILVVWYITTAYFEIDSIFLPTPKKIWECFCEMFLNGYKGVSLIGHLLASMERLMIAFGISLITAIPIGIFSGCFPKINAVLEPIINFYKPLPPLAYYTLLVLWLGIGDSSKITLLFLACFAPLYITCSFGVTKINKQYIYNAQSLGAGKWQVIRSVIFPFILPDIFAGMRTSIGVGFTTLVAAEMVAAKNGIGWLVLDAGKYLRSDVMFVGIIIMGITGIILDKIICVIEKIVVPWKGKSL